MVKIIGLYNRHDGGYCYLENGKIIEHIEFERYNRIKESGGDSLSYVREKLFKRYNLKMEDIDFWTSSYPTDGLENAGGSHYDTYNVLPKEKIKFYSHHLAHCAHAYLSSPFDKSLSIVIDNAGMENDEYGVSSSVYLCENIKISKIHEIKSHEFSLGNIWTRWTRFVFKLSSGYPLGNESGTVMGMASCGDPKKYYKMIKPIFHEDHLKSTLEPSGMKKRVKINPDEDVIHPYLNKFRLIAEQDEQNKFDLAAALQLLTEEWIIDFTKNAISLAKKDGFETKNLCFSGGCALNCVALMKLREVIGFDHNIYAPPVPYDGCQNIGSAQYHYHCVLKNPKYYNENRILLPYLGQVYEDKEIYNSYENLRHKLKIENGVHTKQIAKLLTDNKVIGIFQGSSESGRRALLSRSLVADCRTLEIKKKLSEVIKQRQHYRPIAASMLDEFGNEWFENYYTSPYMGMVFKFKKYKLGICKAVEHFDQTNRLQSVKKEYHPFGHELIQEYHKLTGVPMICNSSANSKEPIIETPDNAIDLLLRTQLDYIYFADQKILVSKL